MFRTALYVAALLALAAVPVPALAQSDPFLVNDFSAIRFYMAPGPGNFLMVEGAETAPDLVPTFGVTLDYAHNPFVADDLDCLVGAKTEGCEIAENQETALLGPLLNLQIYGSITLAERVQIGLNVPVLLYFDGEPYGFVDQTMPGNPRPRIAAPGGSGAGVGDPRLSVKVRLVDPDARGNGFGLALGVWGTAPIGHYTWRRHFIGDRYPTGGGHLILSLRHEGLRLALNVGGQYRDEATNLRSSVGPELTWGAAAAYRFNPLFEALVEATGATTFGERFDSEAPTEIRGALVFYLGEVAIHAGAGAGLVYGVGVPIVRGFAGMTYSPVSDGDRDGDGVRDAIDACPAEAEDRDGFADEDGCPDLDNDEDRVPDAQDQCRDEAEDLDEFEDEDGCPEDDNDGDGVRDGYDSCPNEPEDRDGDRDGDGCPDADADRDGIDDVADQCPNDPEDFDGLADQDGCPETDADRDGVPDESDECPEQRGSRRRRGCPGR